MSFNGSGTFLINTAGQPVVSGTVISSTAFNALTADLATGLSTAITKDGQTTVTANIPMSTYKFTGLGVGSAATDSANLSQVQSTVTKLLNSVSGADTITATASPTLAAYAAGQMFYFVAAGDNTTSVTLNIDALGAKAVTRDGSTALVAADIKSGEVIVVVYDGTRFQVVSQLNSAGNATFANVSITSALNVGGVATLSGNLVFNSTAQRLTADMSNGTVSNRFAFQTSTTNGNTQVNAIPNGTSTTAQFIAYNNADSNNASSIQIAALSTATRLLSGQTGTGTYLPLTFFTSGSEQARLDTSGNLGIGTASPVARLDVFKTSSDTISRTNAVGAFGDYVSLGAGLLLQQTLSSPYGFALQAANAANSVQFPLLLNPSGGNVGIGTASPASKLTVSGDVHILSTNYLNFTNTAQQTYIRAPASNTIAFGTSSTEQMRLDSSGQLGLGVTPRAWAGGYKSLDITGPGAIASTASGDTFTQVANGAWFNGTNWIYQYTGIGAARYQMTGPSGGGNHSWYVANSGTAGNAISFTQAMTLDANINLLCNGGTTGTLVDATRKGIEVNCGSGQESTFALNVNGALTAIAGLASASNFIVGSVANIPMIFRTNNTERARILSTGEFLAGATSAISVAGVSGFHGLSADANNKWATVVRNTTSSTPFGLAINYSAAAPNNTSSNFVYCYDSGALRASIRANGGLANYQANNVDLSDARTKKDIAPAASMWGKVAALEIVAYKYNDQTHDDVNLGVIAQQVESVEPVWVDADGFGDTPEDGVPLKTVYTKDITFAAIKALQEAMARIETLEAKVTALESK